MEEGWKQGISHAMADGIVTQSEESRLREFRDRLALDAGAADPKAISHVYAVEMCVGVVAYRKAPK